VKAHIIDWIYALQVLPDASGMLCLFSIFFIFIWFLLVYDAFCQSTVSYCLVCNVCLLSNRLMVDAHFYFTTKFYWNSLGGACALYYAVMYSMQIIGLLMYLYLLFRLQLTTVWFSWFNYSWCFFWLREGLALLYSIKHLLVLCSCVLSFNSRPFLNFNVNKLAS